MVWYKNSSAHSFLTAPTVNEWSGMLCPCRFTWATDFAAICCNNKPQINLLARLGADNSQKINEMALLTAIVLFRKSNLLSSHHCSCPSFLSDSKKAKVFSRWDIILTRTEVWVNMTFFLKLLVSQNEQFEDILDCDGYFSKVGDSSHFKQFTENYICRLIGDENNPKPWRVWDEICGHQRQRCRM